MYYQLINVIYREAEYVALSNAKDDYQKNAEAERNKLSEEIKSLKHNLAIMKENERNLTEHSTQIQNELKNLTQFVDRKVISCCVHAN